MGGHIALRAPRTPHALSPAVREAARIALARQRVLTPPRRLLMEPEN